VGDEIARRSAAFGKLSTLHERMLSAYRGGEFSSAIALAGEARCIAPARLGDFYRAYEERCATLVSKPDDWSPVTDFNEAASSTDLR
jgi:hypothetical protein